MANKPKPTARRGAPAAEPREQRNVVPMSRGSSTTLAGPKFGTALSDADAKAMQKYANQGMTMDKDDFLIPMINILQDLSPQCLKRRPEYMEGAEPGIIWIKNALHPLISGETGFVFQLASMHKEWVEWIPRDGGGGFAGRYPLATNDAGAPDERICPVRDARLVPDDKGGPDKWKRPNGNEIILTRYHTGFVLDQGKLPFPYSLPVKSTGHTWSKNWMNKIASILANNPAPLWAIAWRIGTVPMQNKKGNWFGYSEPEPISWILPDSDQFRKGEAIARQAANNALRMEAESADGGGGRGADSSGVM